MAYDPGWDMPQPNWQQQGSFESGEIPPAVDPTAGTQICLGPIAQEWLPVILGALDQLRNPSSWIVADDAAMYTTLRRVDKLREIIAVGEGCEVPTLTRFEACQLQTSINGGATWTTVPGWAETFAQCVRGAIPEPVPVLPPDQSRNQSACNLAGYIASEVIKKCIASTVQDFTDNVALVVAANNILQSLGDVFPATAFVAAYATSAYQLYTTYTVAHFNTALGDPTLWGKLTCAIFLAIHDTGYITEANYPTIITNVCALTYTYSEVITALCGFITAVGLENLRAMQIIGALDIVDCTGCGNWCYEWFFQSVETFGIVYGVYAAGVGYEALNCPLGTCLVACNFVEVHGVIDVPVEITDVYVKIDRCNSSVAASSLNRGVFLYLGGVQLAFYPLSNAAISTPTWFHLVVPPTVADGIYIAWPEDVTALGAIISRCAIKYTGSNPYGSASPCTDLPS